MRIKEPASLVSFFNTRKGIPRLPERTGKEPAVFENTGCIWQSGILNVLENPSYYELKEPTLIPKRGFDAISNTCPTLVISSALAACMDKICKSWSSSLTTFFFFFFFIFFELWAFLLSRNAGRDHYWEIGSDFSSLVKKQASSCMGSKLQNWNLPKTTKDQLLMIYLIHHTKHLQWKS